MKLLKGSLNLTNVEHEGPCEVFHKAKQTSDCFPLSENNSVLFCQLIHLDVWGPYKVVSREGFRYFLTIVDDFSRFVCMDGTIKGPGRAPAPPNFAAPSVKIIGFKGNLVVVTNKSPIRPLQNKFGPPKINVQVPSMHSGV